MRSRFDGQLEKLNQEMILMGTMVETAIEGACEALHDRDVRKARDIMAADPAVTARSGTSSPCACACCSCSSPWPETCAWYPRR